MGFYGPSQLVQDARRHGVEVRPVDAALSQWDCALEEGAVRLGLRVVGGLAAAAGGRITGNRPYASVAELARRANLDRKDLKCLAAAGALQSLAGHRRNAHWFASGIENDLPMEIPILEKNAPALASPAEGEDILADYASLGLTLGRHPLALLRDALSSRNMQAASAVNASRRGSLVRIAGLVTCRQRPDTKSGVVFVTLEDESGCVNVVVWSDIFKRYRREILGAQLLGVEGVIERKGQVVHLMARRFVDCSRLLARLLGPLAVASHDFH